MFRNTRPDNLLAHVLRSVLAQAPSLDPASIGDVIAGCAMPEAEQGMNVARRRIVAGGVALYGTRIDGQPLLSLQACRRWRWRRTVSAGGSRGDDCGRNREHELGADDGQQDRIQSGSFCA